MIKRKNILKIAIDSPAAAGAGTLAKAISKQYNLFYLDTGKIYRMIAYLKLKFPKKYKGSVLDGRNIISEIVPDADVKFFITASLKVRAIRRYKELKAKNNKISYQEVLKSIKKRDKSDYNRKISPLKKTKDSVLINTTNLSKRACFLKIKKIIDRKIRH